MEIDPNIMECARRLILQSGGTADDTDMIEELAEQIQDTVTTYFAS